MRIFTYKNLFILLLLFANLFLWLKLDLFRPLISGRTPLLDFDTYFKLLRDLRLGINPYSVGYMQSLGPPTVFFYYFPFSFLDLTSARSTTTLIGILCAFLTTFILSRHLFKDNFLIWFILLNLILFSSFPARFSIEMGQPNLFLMLLLTIILVSKNDYIKSYLSAVIILIKPFFIFTPFAFLKENRPMFIKTILTLFISITLFLQVIKPSIYWHYLTNNFQQILNNGNVVSGLDYYNQSYGSTLGRFGYLLNLKIFYIVFIPLSLYMIYKLKSLELSVILGLIFSFVSWQHYYAVLFPLFVLAYKRSGKIGIRTVILSILFLFWWIEFPFLHEAQRNSFTVFLSSHYFFSAIGLAVYIFFLTRYEQLKA